MYIIQIFDYSACSTVYNQLTVQRIANRGRQEEVPSVAIGISATIAENSLSIIIWFIAQTVELLGAFLLMSFAPVTRE